MVCYSARATIVITPIFFQKLQEENSSYYSIYNTINNNQAFFTNGSYTFGNRYTINGTLRYDAF